MKYIVMEVKRSYAVLLDEDGRFVTAANLRYEVGQIVENPVLMIDSGDNQKKKKRLIVEDLTIQKKDSAPVLDHINLTVHEGEILGIAGVSDNGQQELCEALYGAETPTQGKILLDGRDITATSVKDRITMGMGYTASDRYRYGMVAEMSLAENMLLKASYLKNWVSHGIINWKKLRQYTERQIKEYKIKAPDCNVTVGSLSGGNQQKVVVAREVDMGKSLVIFDQPTRGLDLGAINYVHKTILGEKNSGKSVILVSTELSEIFALSDRIAVTKMVSLPQRRSVF